MFFANEIIDILADNLVHLMDVREAMEKAPEMAVKDIVQKIIIEVLKMVNYTQDERTDDQFIKINKKVNVSGSFDPIVPGRDNFQDLKPKNGKVKREKKVKRQKKKLDFKNGECLFDDSISSCER